MQLFVSLVVDIGRTACGANEASQGTDINFGRADVDRSVPSLDHHSDYLYGMW